MLTQLPPEIIDQIFSHLAPLEIAPCLLTCRLLHHHGLREPIWQRFVQDRMSANLQNPAPHASWNELYRAHHPHMFLVKYKIWYSDTADYGRLLVARYDPRRGCVEAYQLRAKATGPHSIRIVEWGNGEVVSRSFNPEVFLDLNSPVLRLSPEEYMSTKQRFGKDAAVGGSKMKPEVRMHVSRRSTALDGYITNFLYTRDLPQGLCDAQTDLWPPLSIPSPGGSRVRRASHTGYRSKGHAPESQSEVSEASFRIRSSLIFKTMMPLHGSVRFPGEETETFGTIPPSAYTPTPQKPWQGIWVGDYGAHNCEFILVTQPDPEHARPLPEKCRSAFANWPRSTPWQALFPDAVPDVDEMGAAAAEGDDVGAFGPVAPTNLTAALHARHRRESIGEVPPVRTGRSTSPLDTSDEYPYKGRLEALKLTGDPNIPRGEVTFVAEDLGSRGLVGHTKERGFVDPAMEEQMARHADDQDAAFRSWQGTRMVKSCGHVADTSPRRDSYIPSQLLLVSPDILAQWWIPYRYVVFYRRVRLEDYIQC